MNRNEFAIAFAQYSGITQTKSKELTRKFFEFIIDTLLSGENITIQNFGVFKRKYAKGHAIGLVNSEPGTTTTSHGRYRMTFSPCPAIRKLFDPESYGYIEAGKRLKKKKGEEEKEE